MSDKYTTNNLESKEATEADNIPPCLANEQRENETIKRYIEILGITQPTKLDHDNLKRLVLTIFQDLTDNDKRAKMRTAPARPTPSNSTYKDKLETLHSQLKKTSNLVKGFSQSDIDSFENEIYTLLNKNSTDTPNLLKFVTNVKRSKILENLKTYEEAISNMAKNAGSKTGGNPNDHRIIVAIWVYDYLCNGNYPIEERGIGRKTKAYRLIHQVCTDLELENKKGNSITRKDTDNTLTSFKKYHKDTHYFK